MLFIKNSSLTLKFKGLVRIFILLVEREGAISGAFKLALASWGICPKFCFLSFFHLLFIFYLSLFVNYYLKEVNIFFLSALSTTYFFLPNSMIFIPSFLSMLTLALICSPLSSKTYPPTEKSEFITR